MTSRRPAAIRAAALLLATFILAVSGLYAVKNQSLRSTPLMAELHRFSAPDVPALSPSESEVAPLNWDQPIPSNLPGKGLAQHPMLYVGEGYNKILLVWHRPGGTTLAGSNDGAVSPPASAMEDSAAKQSASNLPGTSRSMIFNASAGLKPLR
jgi:hypothetical protein